MVRPKSIRSCIAQEVEAETSTRRELCPNHSPTLKGSFYTALPTLVALQQTQKQIQELSNLQTD